jgi:hypothetical protein
MPTTIAVASPTIASPIMSIEDTFLAVIGNRDLLRQPGHRTWSCAAGPLPRAANHCHFAMPTHEACDGQ